MGAHSRPEKNISRVFKVAPPANVQGLNFESFENDGGPTILRVFKVAPPANVPGLNFENSENGGGPTIFRVFRVATGAPSHPYRL